MTSNADSGTHSSYYDECECCGELAHEYARSENGEWIWLCRRCLIDLSPNDGSGSTP